MFERFVIHPNGLLPPVVQSVFLDRVTSLSLRSSCLMLGVFLYLPVFGQGDSFQSESISEVLVESENETEDTLHHHSHFEENWNTARFNAYEDVTVDFPFKIEFDVTHFNPPMDNRMVVTSRYGKRWGRGHHGIDIDLSTGDEVSALFDGKVRHVGHHYGFGKTIVVRHSNGIETVYAHLSEYKVSVNDTVQAGDLLGLGGATGNARGSHLHLEVRYKGVSINPEYLFDFSKGGSIRSSEVWVTREWTKPFLHNSKRQSDIHVYTSHEEVMEVIKPKRTIPKEKPAALDSYVHIVIPGDTMYSISRRYQLPIEHICKTNDIADATKIKVGQKLLLRP